MELDELRLECYLEPRNKMYNGPFLATVADCKIKVGHKHEEWFKKVPLKDKDDSNCKDIELADGSVHRRTYGIKKFDKITKKTEIEDVEMNKLEYEPCVK